MRSLPHTSWVLAILGLSAAGCADDFVEATCDGALSTVIKGEVRGLPVDVEALDVAGALARDRFHLSFTAPTSLKSENIGDWLLDFGFNPLGGTSSSATLQNLMRRWQDQRGGPKPFFTTSADPGLPCEPDRGALCGGFGVDTDRSGDLERDESQDEERYHRYVAGEQGVKSGTGWVEFDRMTNEEWKARFDVSIDWDERSPTIAGGRLKGCFHTLLVPKGDLREFAAPRKR